MRGRHPAEPEYVRKLQGSAIAKERLQVILETMVEDCRVSEACRRPGISERTLRQWEYDWRVNGLPAERRGRPLVRSSRAQRQEVLDWMEAVGPGIGVPCLQGRFPDMPRAELQDLLRRYREVWRKQHESYQHVLHWQRSGTVWAMDFSESPRPIDGVYPYLLAVRDLASGQQLLWQPVATMTAEVAMAELTMLFTIHGAPMVLKSDNGSAFRAASTKALLQRWGVVPLFSPPGCPGYNGACEASIGSLKKRIAYQAGQAGRAGLWSRNDAEMARRQANEVMRPWEAHGPSPADVWSNRQAVTSSERASFQASVRRLEQEQREAGGITMDAELDHYQQAATDRVAIRRALVAHGLLVFTRRRVPTPIKRQKVTEIM